MPRSTLSTRCPRTRCTQAHVARLERGMKPSSARLTLARKIAAIVLAIWKKEQNYDPTLS